MAAAWLINEKANKMPSTLFIDLDGTIMRNPFWPAVFPLLADHLAARSGHPPAAIIEMIVAENARRRASTDAAWATDWDDIAQTIARGLGVTCNLSVEQLVIDHCRTPYIALLDEADVVLREMAADGWRLVAATHGQSKYQIPVLRALGVYELFANLATPDRRGCFKQQRSFWLPYLEAGGPLVHVGDLYEDDVLAPKSHGLAVVWKIGAAAPSVHAVVDPFERARIVDLPIGQTVQPDAVIMSLRELPGVCRRVVNE